MSSKSLGFLDTWAAKERGFFRKHGLDAEIIAMRPPLTIGALQAGEIDYAIGASTISRGAISGAPVRIVSLALTLVVSYVGRPTRHQDHRRHEGQDHRGDHRRRR